MVRARLALLKWLCIQYEQPLPVLIVGWCRDAWASYMYTPVAILRYGHPNPYSNPTTLIVPVINDKIDEAPHVHNIAKLEAMVIGLWLINLLGLV